MSIYQEMVRRFWPRHTLGAAYLEWQAQEGRLAAAGQRLARDYQAACGQAEQVQIDVRQGILRGARVQLDQPLDPGLSILRGRLQKAFARLGHGLCRRVPRPLEVELDHYARGIGKICRSHLELGARLRLAQATIALFARHPEFCRAHFFSLALNSPESAWLLFHLRQKRLQERQAIQDHLPKIDHS
jgi:hypothetical protein